MLQVATPAVMHCLRRASECERLAALAIEPDTQDTIRRIAECWRSLAVNQECVERIEVLLATGRLGGAIKYPGDPGEHRP
jgi:hypothetical protein